MYGSYYPSYSYSYSYSRSVWSYEVTWILVGLLCLAAAVLAFIFLLPEKRRPHLNKFGTMLADLCNFKGLLLEYITKFSYIVSTVFVVLFGFLTMFDGGEEVLIGLLFMILGPIGVRVLFETTMMFIILVKNVMSINKKMDKRSAPQAQQAQQQAPDYVFCTQCGTRYDKNAGPCPKCGSKQ